MKRRSRLLAGLLIAMPLASAPSLASGRMHHAVHPGAAHKPHHHRHGRLRATTNHRRHRPPPPPSSSTYDAVTLSDGPVAYYAMNGTGTEPDISGHQHAGSYRGGQPTKVTLPNGDSAADFNGSSEYLNIPSSAVFSISTTHQFTWEGWIRPDVLQFPRPADSTGYVDWMGKCQSYSPSCEWEARMYSTQTSQGRPNRLAAYAFNPSAGLGSGADWQPSAGLIQAGRWLFVVGEYQTDSNAGDSGCGTPVGTIDIWVNGIKWDQAAHGDTGCMSQYGVSPQAGSSPINIGTMAFDSWFPGAVGKVAFFDSLLSQQQIDAQYTSMTGLAPSGSCTDTCTLSRP